MTQRVLVIGSGGREHALAWKLAASPQVGQVFVAPGNDGMAGVASLIEARDQAAWVAAAREIAPDLVVIGPEAPLVEGLADRLRDEGMRVFGPSAAAARLEGDKAFAKDFLQSAGIPTAAAHAFDDLGQARAWLRAHPGPWVVKATGLAAGKGVFVCDDEVAAADAAQMILGDQAFGSGHSLLIEERLVGRELSVFALVAGDRFCWFAPSRDYKRLQDGDVGPNTGGMGAYTPVADASAELERQVETEVLAPSVAELQRRGLDYRGLLYAGLMLTREGPRVLEYNCRFGDPETQVVLPAMADDLYPLLQSVARGELQRTGRLPHRGAAVGVVLATPGYPTATKVGQAVRGLERSFSPGDVVFHGGTRRSPSGWETAGGRVFCAVGQGSSLEQARERAYHLADHIQFEGVHRRQDIASAEVGS